MAFFKNLHYKIQPGITFSAHVSSLIWIKFLTFPFYDKSTFEEYIQSAIFVSPSLLEKFWWSLSSSDFKIFLKVPKDLRDTCYKNTIPEIQGHVEGIF